MRHGRTSHLRQVVERWRFSFVVLRLRRHHSLAMGPNIGGDRDNLWLT